MAIERPHLTEAQPGAPITAEDWNGMIRALKALRVTLQELKTRTQAGILVTVRDRDTEDILPPAAIHAVYAVAMATNTLMPPGQRAAGGDQAYLITIDAPGDYQVTVEPATGSGYEQQVQNVTVSGASDIALADFLMWEQPRQPIVPLLFGKTLREARAILDSEGVAVQRVLDAHGEIADPDTWEAQYGNRLVLGTQPGAGMTVTGEDTVAILVAGRLEPVERRPVLVGQIAVARPTRLAISPDGSLLYVLSQGAARGGNTSVTVIDTRRRRVAATIDTGSTPLLNIVFHPTQALAFASVILPELRLQDALRESAVAKRETAFDLSLEGDLPIVINDAGPRRVLTERRAAATDRAASAELAAGLGSASSPALFETRSAAAATTSKMALATEAMASRGSALNQLVTDLGSSAAYSSGVASLAALNLAASLGQGVKARGDQGAIVVIDTAKHQVIPGALIPTDKAICYSLDITSDGRVVYATAPTQRIAGFVTLPGRELARITLPDRASSPAFVKTFRLPIAEADTVFMTDVTRHRLMRVVEGKVSQEFPAGTSPLDFVLTPRGDRAYVINFNLQTGSLVVVNLHEEGAAAVVKDVSPRVVVGQDGFLLSGIDITPDPVGSRICVTVEDGLAIVRDGSQTFDIVKLGGEPAGVVIEPLRAGGAGGKYAYVANFGDNAVQIVDLTGEDEPFVRTSFTGQLFPGRLAELMTVPGINEHIAERLVLSGIQSVQGLAGADEKLVSSALAVNDSQAKTLINRAGRATLLQK